MPAVSYDDLPAGVIIEVAKDPTTGWPSNRPSARGDLVFDWTGPDPKPTIVSSGTGGALNGVDRNTVRPFPAP